MRSSAAQVAVSGLGSIGRQHVEAFVQIGGPKVVAYDPSPTLRAEARRWPGVSCVVEDFEGLLDAEPVALVVASPDFAHVEQLIRATQRGITTLVEKPLAPSVAEARAAIDVVTTSRAQVLVGYVLRYRGIFRSIQGLLMERAIGEVTTFQVMLGAYGTITAASSRFDVPEEGVIYRDYSHEWDYLRSFFGPIDRVFAVARCTDRVPRVQRPNLVDGLMRTVGGIVGSFHLDYVEPRGTRTIHVLGTGGSLQANWSDGTIVLRCAGDRGEWHLNEPEAPARALAQQATHLLQVARGEAAPCVNLNDGLAALAVAEAVRESAGKRQWASVLGEGGTSQ